MSEDLSGLLLGDLNTKVHKAPPEIVNIEIRVALHVHSLEDPSYPSDTERRPVEDLRFQIFDQVFN